MRDRRNTNLSVSSTESAGSTPSRSTRSSSHEKRSPSPTPTSSLLPAPVTKENRPRVSTRQGVAGKVLAALCVVFLLLRFAWAAWFFPHHERLAGLDPTSGLDLIGSYDLPDDPTAIMVTAPDGEQKWTISIPRTHPFPLASHFYEDICTNGAVLRHTIGEQPGHVRGKHWLQRHGTTDDVTFMEIEDAEANGILPRQTQGEPHDSCETSLTFVLESKDASFGKTLLLLWLSYGLAKNEGRAFFIDDTRWAWGKYTSFFAPPPMPKCTRPQSHHIVPCPRNTKHLIVSSATAAWTFGWAFQKEFRAPHKRGPSPIYELLRRGYEDLFELTGDDAVYAKQRVAKLQSEALEQKTPVIGLQVRRGDRHPFEYQYNRDYLPLPRFADAATSLWKQLSASDPNGQSSVLIASDDPDMFTSEDLQQALAPAQLDRAQDRILLATKATLDETSPVHPVYKENSPYVKYMDENSGWEGGFFSALFYSAGGATPPGQNDESDDTLVIPEQALRLRELVGRAYLLDMSVLGSSDGVVCAVSSASCRVLGVIMGWDAIKQGRWRNVDDGRSWSWEGLR